VLGAERISLAICVAEWMKAIGAKLGWPVMSTPNWLNEPSTVSPRTQDCCIHQYANPAVNIQRITRHRISGMSSEPIM
jgi:hypothetical protein